MKEDFSNLDRAPARVKDIAAQDSPASGRNRTTTVSKAPASDSDTGTGSAAVKAARSTPAAPPARRPRRCPSSRDLPGTARAVDVTDLEHHPSIWERCRPIGAHRPALPGPLLGGDIPIRCGSHRLTVNAIVAQRDILCCVAGTGRNSVGCKTHRQTIGNQRRPGPDANVNSSVESQDAGRFKKPSIRSTMLAASPQVMDTPHRRWSLSTKFRRSPGPTTAVSGRHRR